MQIPLNRKLFATVTIFFGALIAVGLARATSAGNLTAAVIVLVVLGLPFIAYARRLFRRGPALVIDDDGLAGFRPCRRVSWRMVGEIHLSQEQGVFGVYNYLVITLRRDDLPPVDDALGLHTSRVPVEMVEFSIDQLAMPWREVVKLIERHLGRAISVQKTAGFRAARVICG